MARPLFTPTLALSKKLHSLPSSIRRIIQPRGWRVLTFSAGGDGGRRPREHDYLERWCGGLALPRHRGDVGFFGSHRLCRGARVARMDSCDPLLATHFLLEKQVEARHFIRRQLPSRPGGSLAGRWPSRLVATAAEDRHQLNHSFPLNGGLGA